MMAQVLALNRFHTYNRRTVQKISGRQLAFRLLNQPPLLQQSVLPYRLFIFVHVLIFFAGNGPTSSRCGQTAWLMPL
jgi:hypothetical protein